MRSLTIPALLLAGAAHAADVDRFEPAGSSAYAHGTLQGEAPWLAGEGFAGGLFASFAQDPVVRLHDDGRRVSEVAAMLPLTLYGAYTHGDKARFEAFLPVYGWVDAPIADYRGAAVGDLRLQANVPVYDDGVAVSIVPRLGLPSGTGAALTGQGVQAGLLGTIAGEIEAVDVSLLANLGVTGVPKGDLDGVGLGSTVDALIGGWWRASEAFRLGTELDLRAGLVRGDEGGSTTSTWHLFAQSVLPSGFGMTLGAGTGVVGGVGAPEFRAFAGITWAGLVADRDRDGVADADDLCPADPEDVDGFQDADGCPDPDNDGDGIGDYTDRCDDAPEDLDGWEDSDGCPDPDNDGDSLADADDLCPDVYGSRATSGCPDRDGDGLVDADDLCPTVFGHADGCPDADADAVADYRDACPDAPKPDTEPPDRSDGCPKLAWLAGDRIHLADRVGFVTTGAVLRPHARELVGAVADLLDAYPQLLQVEVQVHLDDALGEEKALALTQQRADAIVAELRKRGVDAARVVAKGYGKTRPIDTNRTEAGRYANRRVELHILRQEAIPKPVWPDPPATPASDQGAWDPSAGPGTLEVRVEGGGWADVFVDGARISRTAPFDDFRLPPGLHEIRIANRDGLEHTETIELAPGQTITIVAGEARPAPAEPRAAEEPEKPAEFDGNYPIFRE